MNLVIGMSIWKSLGCGNVRCNVYGLLFFLEFSVLFLILLDKNGFCDNLIGKCDC